jgi:hypothetical protein
MQHQIYNKQKCPTRMWPRSKVHGIFVVWWVGCKIPSCDLRPETYHRLCWSLDLFDFHIQIWYLLLLCYLSLILKWLFDIVNDLKSKSCQLQSFITFWDLQLSFRVFSIRGRLKILNFKFEKFKHTFSWQNDFKLKSCQQQSFLTSRDLQLSLRVFSHPMSFEKFEF